MKPKHVAWLILLALVIGACGRSAIEPITSSILIVTPVSAGDTSTGNAACSIAMRNAIFRGIPQAFWNDIYTASRKAAIGEGETLEKKRKAALDYLVKQGIPNDRVFAKLGVQGVEDIDFANGSFTVRGTDSAKAMAEVVWAAFSAHNLPDGFEPNLDSEATFDPVSFSFPHGTHLCAMEVDTETGTGSRGSQGVADLVLAAGPEAHRHAAPRGVQRERRAQLVVDRDATRCEVGRSARCAVGQHPRRRPGGHGGDRRVVGVEDGEPVVGQ